MVNIKNNTISILGCGWFGLALAKKLIGLNYSVKGSTTSQEKLAILQAENIQPFLVNFTAEAILADSAFLGPIPCLSVFPQSAIRLNFLIIPKR